MQVNSLNHGFRVLKIREMNDCGGVLHEMVHEKSGALLCWLKREDENKTFTITFTTTPENDTGVFHILEHSVLNGSEKYPVKEPFVELLKSSLQTYLNAFTYPDKTMYPVASRNAKDFKNLVSVYLDAVLHPAIYTNAKIFEQEGWHYEIHDEGEQPVFNGVVLNEMKGAFASVDEAVIDGLNRLLFPDTCYRFVSGGDPDHITDLTYEQFIETHRKYYHPGNAKVFLDGDIDMDEILALLDAEFSLFDQKDDHIAVGEQPPVNGQETTIRYEIDNSEDENHKTQIAVAKIVSDYSNTEKNIAWNALSSVLVSGNDAPLKKEILERGFAEDVELDLFDGIRQPWVVLNLRNTEPEYREEAFRMIREAAQELCNGELKHSQIEATLNQMEFKYRERREPAGLMYAQRVMNSWLYDGDPALYLNVGSLFQSLREKLQTGYFEGLLAEFLLNDEHQCILTAIPDKNMSRERLHRENEKLKAAKDSWGADTEKYIKACHDLEAWQAEPDTEETLACLPRLALADVERKPSYVANRQYEIRSVPVLEYPEDETGIVYANFYFNVAGIPREQLASLRLFVSMLGDLPTSKHTVQELHEMIRRDLGSLSMHLDVHSPVHRNDCAVPMIVVSVSALQEKIDRIVPIIQEMLFDTVMDPQQIRLLLKQENEGYRQALIMNGQSFALSRVAASNSAEGVFREFCNGYESALWTKAFENDFDECVQDFVADCQMYEEILFSVDRMSVSTSGKHEDLIREMIGILKDVRAERASVHYPLLEKRNEIITIPSIVSYTAYGNHLSRGEGEYEPGMQVMAHMLSYGYLWQEVRVHNGAYGTGFSVSPNGSYGIYSYRDPNPQKSLEAYRAIPAYLQSVEDDGLDQLIIGTVAAFDPLLSYPAKMRSSDALYFRGSSYEHQCEGREKILNTTASDLHRFAQVLQDCQSNAGWCAVLSHDLAENFAENEAVVTLPSIL